MKSLYIMYSNNNSNHNNNRQNGRSIYQEYPDNINNNDLLRLLGDYNNHIRRQQTILSDTISLLRTIHTVYNEQILRIVNVLDANQNAINIYSSILQSINRRIERNPIIGNTSSVSVNNTNSEREPEMPSPYMSSRNRHLNRYANILNSSRSRNIFGNTYFSILNPLLQYSSSRSNGLTNSEIERVTDIIVFDSSMNETRCPISWEDFEEGEYILRIRRCQHIFNETSLRNWLRLNSYCPVCRCNLRQIQREPVVSNESSDTETDEQTERDGEREEERDEERIEERDGEREERREERETQNDNSNNTTNGSIRSIDEDISNNTINSYRGFMQSLNQILQNMNTDDYSATQINTDLSGNTYLAEYIIHFR